MRRREPSLVCKYVSIVSRISSLSAIDRVSSTLLLIHRFSPLLPKQHRSFADTRTRPRLHRTTDYLSFSSERESHIRDFLLNHATAVAGASSQPNNVHRAARIFNAFTRDSLGRYVKRQRCMQLPCGIRYWRRSGWRRVMFPLSSRSSPLIE